MPGTHALKGTLGREQGAGMLHNERIQDELAAPLRQLACRLYREHTAGRVAELFQVYANSSSNGRTYALSMRQRAAFERQSSLIGLSLSALRNALAAIIKREMPHKEYTTARGKHLSKSNSEKAKLLSYAARARGGPTKARRNADRRIKQGTMRIAGIDWNNDALGYLLQLLRHPDYRKHGCYDQATLAQLMSAYLQQPIDARQMRHVLFEVRNFVTSKR